MTQTLYAHLNKKILKKGKLKKKKKRSQFELWQMPPCNFCDLAVT
jgi:hypothetical protein